MRTQIGEWDVIQFNHPSNVASDEMCKQIEDIMRLMKIILDDYINNIGSLLNALGDCPNVDGMLLFGTRIQIIEYMETMKMICTKMMMISNLYGKRELFNKIDEVVVELEKNMTKLNEMADQFYNSDTDVVEETPIHFRHVYVDGKKVEKVLWKKECIELDDD